ncbi:pre-peptidase C-terminal domain-containing protein [Acanthopleuribacter pedis]|uniref:Pre-peptidase C-terminal domain-containing protein n=1 Tax=Acanthopleuribacter pedis TaxID=442870 RepID=A0A8J7U773_9BACT|nr:pre-peptidase C-terminal domain-containing protein [Acanthopleuribacter pedis]MBO1322198.1 pre-peptidase C-terminal domain-containing protein [Acanthopleuribacter pedis]
MFNLGFRSLGTESRSLQTASDFRFHRCTPRSHWVLVLCSFLFCMTALAQDDGQTQVITQPWVGEAVTPYVIETDLRSLPIRSIWQPGDPIKEVPRRTRNTLGVFPKPAKQIDGLLEQQESVHGLVPINQAFPSPDVNIAGQGFSGVNPPDTVGDVGTNYYIQSINGSGGATFTVYDKNNGNLVAGPFNLDGFGSGGCGSGLGDPIILFDQAANRWMISEFASGSNILCVYVSRTEDPVSGGWYAYAFNTPSFPDYPKYGVWNDAYYVGTNESSTSLYALDRTAMLAGQPATSQRFTIPDLAGFGFQMITPADHDGATPAPNDEPGIFMRHRDDEVHDSNNNSAEDYLEIYEFSVDFADSNNSAVTGPIRIPISEFDSTLCGLTSFNCFPQPGSSTTLDPLREVVMNRLQYRNFGTHQTLVGNFVTDVNGNNRGGIRWFELRKTGSGPWTLYQEGTFSPDADNRFMGAISMDGNGNIALGYNVSSSSTAPSLRYVGRLASDPLGTLPQGEYTIVDGSAANNSNRYGDYSAMGVDPVTDCSFWFTGQYNTSGSWSTRIANFGFEACSGCDNPPAAPSGLNASASGDNQISLSWNTAAGATSYRVYRAVQGCPADNATLLADNVAGTSYTDTDVAGGTTYAYVVRAVADNCESDNSNCAEAVGVGPCTTAPTFAGIQSVTSAGTSACALNLSWNAATANCGASVTYHVYRGSSDSFTPNASNRVASCLTATTWTDTNVTSGTTYFYIVRAEDDTNFGNGPCNSGNSDANTTALGAAPGGPVDVAFADDFAVDASQWVLEAGPGNTGSTSAWALVSTDSNSAPNSLFVSDEANIKDQVAAVAGAINLPAGNAASLSFAHRYDTESTYDGGVLEYSVDGTNWFDILAGDGASIPANADRFSTNGYQSTISTSYNSPIGGRAAWSGNSSGFIVTEVNLADFAGNDLFLRWRLACDSSVGGNGWWIDDISVSAASDCGGTTTCTYQVTAAADTFPAEGGTIAVTVDTNLPDCSWSTTTFDPWITILAGSNNQGDLTFDVRATENTTGQARTGSVRIAGETLTFNQPGVNSAPTISIDSPADGDQFNQGDTVTFSGSAQDAEDGDLSASITWSSSLDGNLGTGASLDRSDLSAGNHSITASVTDSNGDGTSASIAISVNGLPQAGFTVAVDGLTINLTDTSSDDGSIAARNWDFGDGNGSSDTNPSHTYTADGTYTVTLTVTDNDGATASTSQDVSVSDSGIPTLENQVPVSGLSAATGEWLYFRFVVPEGASNLDVLISGGTGDADLYTRFGAEPTETEYDCRPFRAGNSESCNEATPAAGEYFIGIRGYSAFSGVTVIASYETSVPGDGFTETGLGASRNNWVYFEIEVPAGRARLDIDISGGSGDADLYIRFGAQPTTTAYDERPYLNGNEESVSIANPAAGTYFIGVRAYRTYRDVTLNAYHFE